nr:hypothetical protein [Tanacetum cinerariifolium]
DTPMVEKSKLYEDREGKAVDPLHYRGTAYRKARPCSQKDLSIPSWNRSSGSMVSEGFFYFLNSFCRCGSRWLPRYSPKTMATTIEQQVALDEALVPSTQRLRIGRSNFRLPSNIQSKESTLQVVYDVLPICPFFKAFLVTADVPEIYMIPSQSFNELPFEEEILEFFRFLGYSAQIRTLTDVNINKLFQTWRSFGAVINKCLTGKSSGFDSFRLSQAQILWGLYHRRNIDYAFLIWEDFVYQVEHKNHKNSNEMYYPGFTKVIIHHFMSKDMSIPRRNKVNWHYVRDDMIFSTIKVVSRHQNTQQYAPKPKASSRRKRSGSDTSITPPTAITTPTTTVVITPRLTAAAKGKQPAKAKSPSNPSEVARKEAQQLKIVLRRSRQQMHISQLGGSGTDEGTGSKPGFPDVPSDDSEEEILWNSSDDEDADAQEKDRDDDEGDEKDESDDEEEDDDDDKDGDERNDDDDEESKSDEESNDEETREEESFDPIPRTPEDSEDDGNSEEDQGLRINSQVTLTPVNPDGQQESSSVSLQFVTSMLNPTSDAADLSEMELKKILIEKMEGNKRDDESDKDEGPSAGSDRGSKRRREGKEPESASVPLQTATRSACRSIIGFKSRQHSDWFSQLKKPPTPDHDWNKTLPVVQGSTQIWISELAKQADSRSSFNKLLDTPLDFSNFIMHRLRVDTLTPELLAGPTYELMKGSCTSLVELEYHLEEVYKATTDQLDWVNPEGQ